MSAKLDAPDNADPRQPDHLGRTPATSDLSFVTEWAMSPVVKVDLATADAAPPAPSDPSPTAYLGVE
jgi:hypothetical protein